MPQGTGRLGTAQRGRCRLQEPWPYSGLASLAGAVPAASGVGRSAARYRLCVARLDDRQAAAYLELLGVDTTPGEVDAEMLARLQRSHLEAVPYENLDIVRSQPPGIEPLSCVRRILAGRGGYCFHLNGSFATLLGWLGVDLTRHLSRVQGGGVEEPPGPNGNHLGLTARVPSPSRESRWLVDVGLGDGPNEPLPLASGTYDQDGRTFRLGPSPLASGGWRFDHDPQGSFVLVDISAEPASTDDFAAMHRRLSTSPDSRFVRVATVQRHTANGSEVLRGCVLTERAGAKTARQEIDSAGEWWSLVLERFGLAYGNLEASERDALWRRVRATHEAWDAAGRP
jgi:N-hydroxyarylamine O-acetyltransferase